MSFEKRAMRLLSLFFNVPGCLDPVPPAIVDPGAVEDEDSFAVPQVEPEVDKSVLDAKEEVV